MGSQETIRTEPFLARWIRLVTSQLAAGLRAAKPVLQGIGLHVAPWLKRLVLEGLVRPLLKPLIQPLVKLPEFLFMIVYKLVSATFAWMVTLDVVGFGLLLVLVFGFWTYGRESWMSRLMGS